jgi:molybdopterin molybdotransferase
MKDFFQVQDLAQVQALASGFAPVATETTPLASAWGRVLAEDVLVDRDLPGFVRATMDGYAVAAASTFGATEANPAYLGVKGEVHMGVPADFALGPGEAARIATGGMLPQGADAVVMIEHTEVIDAATIEIHGAVAPGQHVIAADEDYGRNTAAIARGRRLRPQDVGLLAALGRPLVRVHRQPYVAIISTGDEITAVENEPRPGQVRDVNTFTLASMVRQSGAKAVLLGLVADDEASLLRVLEGAVADADMVLISGGSSVGQRDYTIGAIEALPQAAILVHGVAISPGKPTILARVAGKPVWGLPGHVTSAMVVFEAVVRCFLDQIGGVIGPDVFAHRGVSAVLSRNVASAQGRTDYIRVRLVEEQDTLWAEPVLGKSGLLSTMVRADGLVAIGKNSEGLERGVRVNVLPF